MSRRGWRGRCRCCRCDGGRVLAGEQQRPGRQRGHLRGGGPRLAGSGEEDGACAVQGRHNRSRPREGGHPASPRHNRGNRAPRSPWRRPRRKGSSRRRRGCRCHCGCYGHGRFGGLIFDQHRVGQRRCRHSNEAEGFEKTHHGVDQIPQFSGSNLVVHLALLAGKTKEAFSPLIIGNNLPL